ncbi:MAG: hypothetical protein J6S14_23060 [Clostridia bacterium]|nr:hypothetical protein [Clostridia bacterium]
MDENITPQEKEAYSIADQIHSAARIMEQAIINEDAESKKALRNAAKVLIDSALKRFDESIGTAILEDDDE